MLNIIYTKAFKQDYKKIIKQGKNIKKIDGLLYDLAHNLPLDKKLKDHQLIGNYNKKRECHISPDWLLIYETTSTDLILYRTGSHNELFKK